MGDEVREGPDVHLPSAVSWRDIYRAVAESEVRVVAAINAAVQPLNISASDHEMRIRHIEVECAKAQDHEQRMRAIEQGGSPEAQEAAESVKALGVKHAMDYAALDVRMLAIERIETALEGRQSGIMATLNATQRTVILVAAILGMALTINHIITDLITPTVR